MKLRVLEVMNDALGLVKKSDLSGATALIRKALSGEPAEESESESKPHRPSAKVIPLPPRRPLGETLRALRAPADHPAGAPDPPRGRARPRRTLPQADV